ANFADGNVQPPRDLPREILRAHVALLDPQVQKLPRAARMISGDFLDLEIVVNSLDAPADARQVGGQKRRWREQIPRHGGSLTSLIGPTGLIDSRCRMMISETRTRRLVARGSSSLKKELRA